MEKAPDLPGGSGYLADPDADSGVVEGRDIVHRGYSHTENPYL